jgi:hypothetical protein
MNNKIDKTYQQCGKGFEVERLDSGFRELEFLK